MICNCDKPLTGINPDDDIGGECSRCGGEILDEEIERCPKCDTILKTVWDNSGFTEPDGPSYNRIIGVECPECGYTDN